MAFFKLIPNHIWVAASSWGARGISACIQIISVHYLVSLLGEDKYSAFILLSGLVTWCNLSDFGIGNSILNFVSERKAQAKRYGHLIIVAMLLTFLLCVIIAIVLFFIASASAEIYLQAYSAELISNKVILFYISTLILCCTALSSLIYKIWYAEQIGWLSNLFPAISSLVGLFGIIAVSEFSNNLVNLLSVFIIFFSPALILSFILLCLRLIKELKRIDVINFKIFFLTSKKIIKRARPFFVFAIMGAIVLQTDLIVLSQKGAASEIILYGVLLKIFNVIYFIYSAVLQAWWPVCTELRVRKQWEELRKSIRMSIILGSVAIVFLTFIVYILQDYIWEVLGLGGVRKGTFLLFCLFAAYFIIRAWCDTYAVLLQTMDSMKPLFVIVPIQAVINFTLQWYLISELSLVGILLGSIVSFALTVAIYLPYKFNEIINKEIK